ncbi:hypothetical protein [uncultured Sphingomonas sp.]|uniref:hypothetical protein n=1 Tax=uncultured Sphingomonas sp. TaxID=158754 RepID=UPI0025CFF7AD|nr:hypothetical protein [uncultured Sphingomonas sp.]
MSFADIGASLFLLVAAAASRTPLQFGVSFMAIPTPWRDRFAAPQRKQRELLI